MNSKLFSSYQLKNIVLKNRIVMSPMCMYSCMKEDGKVTNWHLTHYTSRAVGQVGLLIVEATAVLPEGRISERDLGIWDDEHVEGLSKIARLVHEQNAHMGIQLAHAGRKSATKGDIFAPSAIAFSDDFKTPNEMTISDIEKAIMAFQQAARRAKEAGFDVIELHGAHGYLINEFLSPLSNKRTDKYGGSPENRYRFLQEVIYAVKKEWDGPLFVRISATDYHPEGLTVEDYLAFAMRMKEQGVDLIDCSSGAVVPTKISVYPGYQVQYADTIRNKVNIATGAVGLITTGNHAEEILRNDRADLIFLGRELLRDPYWPRVAAKQLNDSSIEEPTQYGRAWKR